MHNHRHKHDSKPNHNNHNHNHNHTHKTAEKIMSGLGKALYAGAVVAGEIVEAVEEERRYERHHRSHDQWIADQARASGYSSGRQDAQRAETKRKEYQEFLDRQALADAQKVSKKAEIDALINDATKLVYGQAGIFQSLGSYLGVIDDLKSARDKLNTAQLLAKSIGYSDAITRINNLTNRLLWLESKPDFVAEYSRLITQAVNMQFTQELQNAITAHINFFKCHNKNPAADELQMLNKLNEALDATSTALTREADRKSNLRCEANIIQYIIEAEAAAKLFQYKTAAHYLACAKDMAKQINYVDDISHKEFKRQAYFDESINVLKTADKEFNDRAASLSVVYANELIAISLAACNLTDNKTLIGRHRKRLEKGIIDAFLVNWLQFDNKSPDEFAGLFKQIREKILLELQVVTIGKTLGTAKQNGVLNIDLAGLYLKDSKGITPAIVALITQHRSSTLPRSLAVPIFAQSTEQRLYIPYAQTLDTGKNFDDLDLPVAALALVEETLPDAPPSPSAPPIPW